GRFCCLAHATNPARSLYGALPGAVSSTLPIDTCVIGVKSFTGSNGSLANSTVLFTWVELVVIMKVYPSPGAWATTSAPLIVLAPGIASTTTGWPRRALSFSAMTRLRTSIAPPGLNGEISLIGRFGHGAWASAADGNAAARTAAANRQRRARRLEPAVSL